MKNSSLRTILAVIVAILALLRLGYRVLRYISDDSSDTSTSGYYTNYSMKFSPIITQFTGKHYEEDAKLWHESPNAIQSLKNIDVPISNLQQMRIAKIELENRDMYVILCLSDNPYQEDTYNMSYFFMAKNQYDLLKVAIDNGKQNFSIKSYLYGNFKISEAEKQEGGSKIKLLLGAALSEYEQKNNRGEYNNPPKMEFLTSSIQKGDKPTMRFLIPDFAEIELSYFQNNYFEISTQEFKEMLID